MKPTKLFTLWFLIFTSTLILNTLQKEDSSTIGVDIKEQKYTQFFGNGIRPNGGNGFGSNGVNGFNSNGLGSNIGNGVRSNGGNNFGFNGGNGLGRTYRNRDVAVDKKYSNNAVGKDPHDMLILSEHNPSGKVNGGILREGDILQLPNSGSFNENDINIPNLWQDGKIYYEFEKNVDGNLRQLVLQAMKEWEDGSCLTFVSGCPQPHTCVRITTQTNLCSSLIGRAPAGQHLNLASNCHTLKIVRHELGHVIGFYHEQSRYDRDHHIHINRHNLSPGTDQEFTKYMGTWGAEYDYSSVMQYDAKSFSKDRINKNTMVTPNPHYQTLMGNSKALSFRDKFRVNHMYSCSARCPNKIQCQNGGFLSPYKGQACYCVCPPRISGSMCENKPYPYEYYDVPACSCNVTQPTTIQTPGYPRRTYPPEKCSYWIQAPRGRRIQVSFDDFSFAGRDNGYAGANMCYSERVEIRTLDVYSGDMYCGEELRGKTFTSGGDNFIIIIDNEDNIQSARGLKARVTFV